MLKVTWRTETRKLLWAVGEKLTFDELDGWTLTRLRTNNMSYEPGGTLGVPARHHWEAICIEQVPDETMEEAIMV